MEYLSEIIIVLLISTIIAIIWANLIANTHENNSDYTDGDFLNWGDDEHQRAAAGRDGWDSIDTDDFDWHPDSNI